MSALTSLRLGASLPRWRPLLWPLKTEQNCVVSSVRCISNSRLVFSSNAKVSAVSAAPAEPKTKMSTAMKFYLEKKREHDSFIAQERSEFEMGKKHLANMMGMEVEAMTQDDIDKAIDYLFPSGLYDPEARPIMKPPEEVRSSIFENHINAYPYMLIL